MAIDERAATRVAVSLFARLHSDRWPSRDVEVTDFTHLGCRIEVAERISIGSFVTLGIPNFIDVAGWVAWSRDGAIGLDFSHALPMAVYRHIIALDQ